VAVDSLAFAGFLGVLAAAIYAAGTVFHFGADYQKHRFKLREG